MTDLDKGCEHFKRFYVYKGSRLYKYHYRHTDGDLFSCTRKTLSECRAERDKWLSDKMDTYIKNINNLTRQINKFPSAKKSIWNIVNFLRGA